MSIKIIYEFLEHFNPEPKKKRDCLRCSKSFSSYGKHNRLCYDCRVMNTNTVAGSMYRKRGGKIGTNTRTE